MDSINQRKLIIALSFLTMCAGAIGMMFCLPFLFSSNMADLVGAGFPFVGGAILFGSGLITYAMHLKKE
jgi:zinc transporter ZupT